MPDGSCLSRIYSNAKDKLKSKVVVVVRVIEYKLEGVEEAEPLYLLISTLLDAEKNPARELAALYPERREVEITLDKFKTHMRGGQQVLRSKTPKPVEQEFYGMMLAHRAVRRLVNKAALRQNLAPDRFSFTQAILVARRKLACDATLFPLGLAGLWMNRLI